MIMAFERMKNLLSSNIDKALDMAQVRVNPELRGIHALAASFALLVMADRVAEEDEKEAVSEYLIDMDIVIEKGLIREISELFLNTVTKMEQAKKKGIVEFNIVYGEILGDISLIKDDEEYADLVANTVTLVTSGGSADKNEIKTRERILKALGR